MEPMLTQEMYFKLLLTVHISMKQLPFLKLVFTLRLAKDGYYSSSPCLVFPWKVFNQRTVSNLFSCYHWRTFPMREAPQNDTSYKPSIALLVSKQTNWHISSPVGSSHPARRAYSSPSPPHGRPMALEEAPCFSRCPAPWNTSPHSLWPDTDFSLSFALLLYRDPYV